MLEHPPKYTLWPAVSHVDAAAVAVMIALAIFSQVHWLNIVTCIFKWQVFFQKFASDSIVSVFKNVI